MEEKKQSNEVESQANLKIKFFRRSLPTVSIELQRKNNYSLQLFVSTRKQEAKQVTQFLKVHRSSFKYIRKVKLKLYATGRPSKIPSLVVQIGKSLRNLLYLDLKFDKESLLKEEVPSIGVEIASSLRKLKCLSLAFQGNDQLTNTGIKVLMSQIGKKLRGLEGFSLNLYKTAINTLGVKYLADRIGKKLSKLRSLSLKFEKSGGLTASSVSSLAFGLTNRLELMRILNISFDCSFYQISDIEMNELAEKIGKCFKNLECLSFGFTNCYRISTEGILNLAPKFQSILVTLRYLELNFLGSFRVSSKGLEKLVNQLGANGNSLHSLSFKIHYPYSIALADVFAQQFTKNFNSLQWLNLSFYSTSLSEREFKSLSASFQKNLAKLKHLKINVDLCVRIVPPGIKAIPTQIGKYLTDLQSLSLNFSFNNAAREGWEKIGSQLGANLRDLKYLELGLMLGKTPITNYTMIAWVTDFGSRFESLETLKLKTHYTEINEKGLKTISEQFSRNFPRLKNLCLPIFSFENITVEGFQEFVTDIVRIMQRLRMLELGFQSCEFLTKDCFRNFLNQVERNIKHFQQVKFDFQRCNNWNEDLSALAIEAENRLQKRGFAVSFSDFEDV